MSAKCISYCLPWWTLHFSAKMNTLNSAKWHCFAKNCLSSAMVAWNVCLPSAMLPLSVKCLSIAMETLSAWHVCCLPNATLGFHCLPSRTGPYSCLLSAMLFVCQDEQWSILPSSMQDILPSGTILLGHCLPSAILVKKWLSANCNTAIKLSAMCNFSIFCQNEHSNVCQMPPRPLSNPEKSASYCVA